MGASRAVLIDNSTFEVTRRGVIDISGEDIVFTNNYVQVNEALYSAYKKEDKFLKLLAEVSRMTSY